jgi:hypothetical protein
MRKTPQQATVSTGIWHFERERLNLLLQVSNHPGISSKTGVMQLVKPPAGQARAVFARRQPTSEEYR